MKCTWFTPLAEANRGSGRESFLADDFLIEEEISLADMNLSWMVIYWETEKE
jgi:hypothetical protein